MSRDALKTLFHPFEAGMLPMPPAGAPCLVPRRGAGFSSCRTVSTVSCRWCRASGPISWRCSAKGIASAPGRRRWLRGRAGAVRPPSRRERARIAEALERVADGGLVVVAGGKEEGVASLAKRLGKLVALDGQAPKYHGLAFWFRVAGDRRAVAGELRRLNPPALIDGRFETAPGMFSHGRDRSRLETAGRSAAGGSVGQGRRLLRRLGLSVRRC